MLTPARIQEAIKHLSFRTNCFIHGHFAPAVSGKTFPTENPATGSVLTQVAAGDKEDIDAAVKVRSFVGFVLFCFCFFF